MWWASKKTSLCALATAIFADQVGRFVGLSNRHHDIALFDILGQSVRVEFQQPGVLVPA